MKSRILSIALAFSMLATVFVALSASAATPYTGSVKTTDNLGAAKDLFFYGDNVYVNAELRLDNVWYAGSVTVAFVSTDTGSILAHYHVTTNNPDVGWNNGSVSGHSFWTGAWGFAGDLMVYDVVLYAGNFGEELARSSVTVKATGLTLSPPSMLAYYPGEVITVTLITSHTTDMFYTQIVNDTGVTMPNCNWTAQIAPSGYLSWTWTIASDFPDGDYTMNVRDSTTHAIQYNDHFSVQKFILDVSSDRDDYLPGEQASMRYMVIDLATLSTFTDVDVNYSAHWVNSIGNESWQNDTLGATSGTHVFTIPTDANMSYDVDITYWANETGSSRSAEDTVTLYLENLYASVDVGGPYMPGDTVMIHVNALCGGDDLPGANVDIAVEKNGTVIDSAIGLTTDLAGEVGHSFILASNAEQGTYVVNVTISKVGYTITRMTVFTVEYDGFITITLDKAYYYSGDTVEMTFRAVWNNQEITPESIAYFVQASFGMMLVDNTTTNTASFDIPQDYYGHLSIMAIFNHDGYLIENGVSTDVRFASLVLSAASDTYAAGDRVTFQFEIVTSLTSAALSYEIIDDDGVRVASDEPSFVKSGEFSFTVPEVIPSDQYTATMTLTSESGALVSASVTVYLASNFDLSIWIGRSGYFSGEFKPGQTLKIHYNIETRPASELPMYRLVVSVDGDPTDHIFLVTDKQGVVEVVLLKQTSAAYTEVGVNLWDPVGGGWLSSDGTNINVNSELGAWDKSVGGMSAIDFTLLVLIVILMLLLIIVPFLKGKMGEPKPEKPVTAPAEPPKP